MQSCINTVVLCIFTVEFTTYLIHKGVCMRVLMAIALFVCLSMASSAQSYIFDKGSLEIGGNVGFTSMSSGGNSFTSLNLSPSLGFFVIKNLEVGASLSVNS